MVPSMDDWSSEFVDVEIPANEVEVFRDVMCKKYKLNTTDLSSEEWKRVGVALVELSENCVDAAELTERNVNDLETYIRTEFSSDGGGDLASLVWEVVQKFETIPPNKTKKTEQRSVLEESS